MIFIAVKTTVDTNCFTSTVLLDKIYKVNNMFCRIFYLNYYIRGKTIWAKQIHKEVQII